MWCACVVADFCACSHAHLPVSELVSAFPHVCVCACACACAFACTWMHSSFTLTASCLQAVCSAVRWFTQVNDRANSAYVRCNLALMYRHQSNLAPAAAPLQNMSVERRTWLAKAVHTYEEASADLGSRTAENVGVWTLVSQEMARTLSDFAGQLHRGMAARYIRCVRVRCVI